MSKIRWSPSAGYYTIKVNWRAVGLGAGAATLAIGAVGLPGALLISSIGQQPAPARVVHVERCQSRHDAGTTWTECERRDGDKITVTYTTTRTWRAGSDQREDH